MRMIPSLVENPSERKPTLLPIQCPNQIPGNWMSCVKLQMVFCCSFLSLWSQMRNGSRNVPLREQTVSGSFHWTKKCWDTNVCTLKFKDAWWLSPSDPFSFLPFVCSTLPCSLSTFFGLSPHKRKKCLRQPVSRKFSVRSPQGKAKSKTSVTWHWRFPTVRPSLLSLSPSLLLPRWLDIHTAHPWGK